MDTAEQWKSLWPFSELDPIQLGALTDRVRRRVYDSGRLLFQENDPAHSLYLVRIGAVHLQRCLPDGTCIHLSRYRSGELVDEGTLPDGTQRTADAVAVGPCEVLVIDGSAFQRCMEASPRSECRFQTGVIERQRRRMLEWTVFATRPIVERVAVTVLELVEVYGSPDASGARRLTVTFTQEELAQWVGTQRESVNRTLANFKRMGAIRVEGRQLVVLNETRLRALSERP
jgi:CRP-like cAMP-binding protein